MAVSPAVQARFPVIVISSISSYAVPWEPGQNILSSGHTVSMGGIGLLYLETSWQTNDGTKKNKAQERYVLPSKITTLKYFAHRMNSETPLETKQ